MNVKKILGKSLYKLFRHFPMSDTKVNFGAKKLRYFCAKLVLPKCGNNVNVEKNAQFAWDLQIGDNSGIGVNSIISTNVKIGKDVMMGPDCMILTQNHGMDDLTIPMWKQPFTAPRPVVIEDDVWIGGKVIILPGVKIGRGSVIGAGSVVTKDISPYSIAVGNPAKVVKKRN